MLYKFRDALFRLDRDHPPSAGTPRTWEAWEFRDASCELLGSAAVSDVRAVYGRLAKAMSDLGADPKQRWLLGTSLRPRQLVVRLDGMTPQLLLLDGDAVGLPVVLRWPIIWSRVGVSASRG